jgi:hypothetical protein
MAKSARPPEQGKDIGIVRGTAEGAVWVTEEEAKIAAKKYGGKVRKVRGGWLAPAGKHKKSN